MSVLRVALVNSDTHTKKKHLKRRRTWLSHKWYLGRFGIKKNKTVIFVFI